MGKRNVPATIAALVFLVIGVSGPAAASAKPSAELRQMCVGNKGTVPGTNGIYSLRASNTSCRTARLVVRKFHTKQSNSGGFSHLARGFRCNSNLTAGSEGLMVRCRRGTSRVSWTAYLDSSVRN